MAETRDATRRESLAQALCNRVKKNRRRLAPWLRANAITCWRMYDADIPEIPLLVDLYQGEASSYLHVAVRESKHMDHPTAAHLAERVADLVGVPRDHVFVKVRRRVRGGTLHGAVDHRQVTTAVREGGLCFEVNLSDHLDTGLFLDHRRTRAMVRQAAAGKRVLNLFCYTGAFTVYAAAGGAASSVSVDLSSRWLAQARRNLERNRIDPSRHHLVRADALSWLRTAYADAAPFDIVVLDPPTVSKSKAMRDSFCVQDDHRWMLEILASGLRPGGTVFFSTNFRKFHPDMEGLPYTHVEEITDQTVPKDFFHRPHRCFRLVR